MIPRPLSKLGLWLFVLAIIWYVVGNSLLADLKKAQLAQAKDKQIIEQKFDVGSSGRVVIRKQDADLNFDGISLILDPDASQATIHNEHVRIPIAGKVEDAAFVITVGRGNLPVSYSSEKIEIRLPASISQIEISGVGSVDLTGRLPVSASTLSLGIATCDARFELQDVAVKQLKLVSSCQAVQKNCCTSGFELGDKVQVGRLDVAMQYGELNISGDVVPQETLLNVGDEVHITGKRAFFQSARFSHYLLKN
ncbi:hypothetical protein ACO0LC_11310 [Undibacterium sp. JH2W]|uniref:hypothetical protein n=1 Tax=Undibacterium sp. JH2W TaxID=3413037 RepID=UPI003BF140E6